MVVVVGWLGVDVYSEYMLILGTFITGVVCTPRKDFQKSAAAAMRVSMVPVTYFQSRQGHAIAACCAVAALQHAALELRIPASVAAIIQTYSCCWKVCRSEFQPNPQSYDTLQSYQEIQPVISSFFCVG